MSHCKGCPWLKPDYNYGVGVIRLHEEIEHFYTYILPTPCEHVVRNELVNRIEGLIQDLWPQAVLEIFGSFRTGMFLPSSDIDVVVFGLWECLPLRTLESELLTRGFAQHTTLTVLDKAVVPIIKFIDCVTNLKVDISFNIQSGVRSAELVKGFKRDFPGLGKLVMILKQFLLQRGLNEVFTGGLSSYSLVVMCVSFFQLHPRNIDYEKANFGVLLLEFFELYGCHFNYPQIEISVANNGCYVRGNQRLPLSIPDPVQPSNDLGRGCSKIVAIKQTFQWAFHVLQQAVHPLNASDPNSNHNSILGRIIYIDDNVVDYRAWLNSTFKHLVVVENVQ